MKLRKTPPTEGLVGIAMHVLLGIGVTRDPLVCPQQPLNLKPDFQFKLPRIVVQYLLHATSVACQLGPVAAIHTIIGLRKYLHITRAIRAKGVNIRDVTSGVVIPPPAKAEKIGLRKVSPIGAHGWPLLSEIADSRHKDQEQRDRQNHNRPSRNFVRGEKPNPACNHSAPYPLQECRQVALKNEKQTSENKPADNCNDDLGGRLLRHNL